MQRIRFSSALPLAMLLFVGAGCAKPAIVTVPPEQTGGTTSLTPQAETVQPPAIESGMPIAPEENTDQPITETIMYQVPKEFPGVLPDAELKNKQVRISTPKGDIVFDVLADEAPKAASNMVALARSGYYDGLTFHRVVANFVIQGGDPTGSGAGGPGYQFEDEPVRLDYQRGIVAMANAGPNTNGSQFFVVTKDQPNLPKLYTIFGRVIFGMDVVDRIVVGDVMTTVTVEAR